MDPALAIEVAALSQQKAMNEATARGNSEVQRFYENSVIFLTGGSGFIGKQLTEKLLRSCKISKLYLLLRPKKGKDVQERLAETLKDPVFDMLRKQEPGFSNKIVAVNGDVGEIRLGITNEDWEALIEEVDVIFHVAATTRFDETLRLATLINVRGAREAMIFGKACKKLRSYVHVSTAYAHATIDKIGDEVREEFYDSPVPPEAMISMAEKMDDNRLMSITNNMIEGWPNSYTFTKSISEHLVRTMSDGLPICIVRPAVVLGAYREPSPGWLDLSCVYGASGVFFAIGMGLLHTLWMKHDVKVGFVPCDYVNNAIIVAGRENAKNQTKGGIKTEIYTVSSTQRNPVTFELIEKVAIMQSVNIPSPEAVYYNYEYSTSNYWLFTILSLFLHLIPAYIADCVYLLIGKQRRFVKLANKLNKLCKVLSYFQLNEWQLMDDNLEKLYSNLSEEDRTIFNFDITNVNWVELMTIEVIGLRKFILKDGLKDTEYGIKKQRVLRIAHYFIMTLYIYGIWKTVSLVVYIFTCIFNFI